MGGENTDSDRFKNFFKKATGYSPFPFQTFLAIDNNYPSLIEIPTGCGKTAGILLSWLYRRRYHQNEKIRESTPRRLVYCLPTRSLVEQTTRVAKKYLENLGAMEHDPADCDSGTTREGVRVSVLMGGEEDGDWDIYPEKDAILIGTQDMLLSRALNRGYGMSRYRWPVEFGLLNNDCMWVMDEVQLMGVGLATSAQLDGLRDKLETMGGNHHSVWMSATIKSGWLQTVDSSPKRDSVKLGPYDWQDLRLKEKALAEKVIYKANFLAEDTDAFARETITAHLSGTRTVAIVNTVKRAVDLYSKIIQKLSKEQNAPKVVLLHSHFREDDKTRAVEDAIAEPGVQGTIIVSTQVIEAGMDLSARTLFTELSPLSSIVQRMGRCNRNGEWGNKDSTVYWVDMIDDETWCLPYNRFEMGRAREKLTELNGSIISPKVTSAIYEAAGSEELANHQHTAVIRRKDLMELFDTTADIDGNDIDISKYVRDSSDQNAHVFWRESPTEESGFPSRFELCPAPVSDVRKIAERAEVWTLDYYKESWTKANKRTPFYPGMLVMIEAKSGGYSKTIGWSPKSKEAAIPINGAQKKAPSFPAGEWETLAMHSDSVVAKMEQLLDQLHLDKEFEDTLLIAARWHDAGKAHDAFQAMVVKTPPYDREIVAKAPRNNWRSPNLPEKQEESGGRRKKFRHELVSMLMYHSMTKGASDMARFLIISHHGKVRTSIRSAPGEYVPPDSRKRFARGVWDGDLVQKTDLGGGIIVPQMTIDLSLMEMGDANGEPSWLSRSSSLLRDYHPFKLAYLEALLKSADERASGGML